MAYWVILKRDNESQYFNLDGAYRISHVTRPDIAHNSFVINFPGEQVNVRNELNPATYAHICAYLGINEGA